MPHSPERFQLSDALYSTGKRPYGCKVPGCGRQFARRNTYLKHFKRQHPELPPPTSNSVRALHQQTGALGRPFLVSGGSVPPSGSDSQEYGTSPSNSGPPHPYAASHPPESAAYSYSNGGFVNGMLHSSQLAPNQAGSGLHPYFHPSHPEAQGHGPLSSLTHSGGSSDHTQEGNQAGSGNRGTDLQYPQPAGQMGFNGSLQQNNLGVSNGGSEGGDQSIFSYQDNSLSRMSGNGGGPMTNSTFYYKQEASAGMRPFQSDSNMVTSNPWGQVGGFTHSQLSLPSLSNGLQPPYHPQQPQQQQPQPQQQGFQQPQQGQPSQQQPADSVKSEPKPSHSPVSERANTPEPLVDINAVPKITYPPQPMPNYPPMASFTGLQHSHMPSPIISGMPGGQPALHAVPPQMQRFHSAPILPTINNNGWHQFEQLKATTPGAPGTQGFGDARMPLRRIPMAGESWQQISPQSQPQGTDAGSHDASDGESASGKGNKTPGLPPRVPEWNPNFPMVRGAQFRYASTGSTVSTGSSMINATQTPQTLPPMNMFTSASPTSYFSPNAPQAWTTVPTKENSGVAPNMLARPGFIPPHMAQQGSQDNQTSPDKLPMGRDRQASGVSSVGFGLANVTFDENDVSGDEDDKPWTPSVVGSPDEGEEELDSEDDDGPGDDDSDDDFVLCSKPKRKGSGNGSGKRGRGRTLPRPAGTQQQRRVLA